MQGSSQGQVARLDAPSFQLARGGALQGDGSPDFDHSQVFNQDHETQLNASSYHSPISDAPEVCSP